MSVSTSEAETDDLGELYHQKGLTDGLPIVVPTEARVRRMVEASGKSGDVLIAAVPPRRGAATVEKIAVNAVMAGCLPEYMPVLIAAVEALCDPRANANGFCTTTGGPAALLIVSGPVVKQLGFNYDRNVFGPGVRANATVGRALRLVIQNIGGAISGELDSGCQGHPGKFSFCIAEHQERNPWGPLHVERGLAESDSAVTLVGAYPQHLIMDHRHNHARGILTIAAHAIANIGGLQPSNFGEVVVVLCPEHAEFIAADGWTKHDIQMFLYEHAGMLVKEAKLGGQYTEEYFLYMPKWVDHRTDDQRIPPVWRPEDFIITVAGGPGRVSCYIPTHGYFNGRGMMSVTKRIDLP